MIQNRNQQLNTIVTVIQTKISGFRYRDGPSLYFYQRIRQLRSMHPSIATFINCDYCLEILYATLVSWDMDSRGAKMKNFGDFCQNLCGGLPQLQAVEQTIPRFSLNNYQNTLQSLSIGYDVIDLMSTQSKLVSNSKCFHFLFPEICSPMDTTNTLKKIYGNTNESKK